MIPKAISLTIALGMGLVACTTRTSSDRPTVVVTYSVLGDIVTQLVGDFADVDVIIPNGQDPHEFEPSAKNVEKMNNAALIVTNGANLEENLIHLIDEARRNGVAVFAMSDHVTTRMMTDDGMERIDPHLWLDPMTIHEAIPDLARTLGAILEVDLTTRSVNLQQDLATADSQAAANISTVRKCTLVTSHDELGYFAARYGCTVVGAIIPGPSTSAEATAGQIAELKRLATLAGVRAIFADSGSATHVARQLAQELNVQLIVLSTHRLERGDRYQDFLVRISRQIADALN